MTEARSLLLERFDGDVRRRLKIAGEQAKVKVGERMKSTQALTGSVLGQRASGRRQLQHAAKEVRTRTNDAVSYLALDASTLPGKLESLAGKEGWWFAYRVELSGLKAEEKVMHLVMVRDGDSFRALPLADAEQFSKLGAKDELTRKSPPVSVTLEHEKAVVGAKDELVRMAERKNALELDSARERADRFAEDCLLQPRAAVEKSRDEWETARRKVLTIDDSTERLKQRGQSERLERDYRKKLQALRAHEEQKYAEKDRTLA